MKKSIRIVLILICAAVAVFAAWKIWSVCSDYEMSERVYTDATEQFVTVLRAPEENALPDVENERKQLPLSVDFQALQALNPDVVGWIYLPDSRINYPVVRGEDNDFYMNHMYDLEWNPGGAIFMDYRCDLDSANVPIYGHHMKDGSMFENLQMYADQAWYDTHSVIWYFTPDGVYQLLPFAASVTTHDSVGYQIEFEDNAQREAWVNGRIEESDFVTDVRPGKVDTILTLATCAYDFEQARYLVHCVLVPFE